MAQQLSAQASSSSAHRAALAQRHAALEARLDSLGARPHVDEAEMKRLKREKLRLKDALARN